ncbi:hypothetical protein [Streptomyces sp. NPDC005181]|uniref:hypothetical protein n=1 Tax=Streptomyces sp. NPDC005181 TaxID=3156869 RepID=UPI0033ACD417
MQRPAARAHSETVGRCPVTAPGRRGLVVATVGAPNRDTMARRGDLEAFLA